MLVIQRTGERKLQIRRQGAVHLLEEIIRRHLARHRHIQNFLFSRRPGGQRRRERQQNMRIIPIGIRHGQPRTAQRAHHRPLNVQMPDVAQADALFKHSHYPQYLHTPLKRCRPQPLQPLRQSLVVCAFSAFSFSRHRNSFVTPQSITSHGMISSFSRRR